MSRQLVVHHHHYPTPPVPPKPPVTYGRPEPTAGDLIGLAIIAFIIGAAFSSSNQ